jgi:hypothetical protein
MKPVIVSTYRHEVYFGFYDGDPTMISYGDKIILNHARRVEEQDFRRRVAKLENEVFEKETLTIPEVREVYPVELDPDHRIRNVPFIDIAHRIQKWESE